jgi:hypothetical protein
VLRSIRDRSCASMDVLDMQVRDDCLFRLDLRLCIGDCMRIGGKFGGVLAVYNMRRRGGKEGGRLNRVRIAYRVGGGMR